MATPDLIALGKQLRALDRDQLSVVFGEAVKNREEYCNCKYALDISSYAQMDSHGMMKLATELLATGNPQDAMLADKMYAAAVEEARIEREVDSRTESQ
jgi:hypothetical protein